MALIACPQCDHQISDKALACPKCGFSLNISIKESAQSNLDFKPRIDDALAAKLSEIKELFSGKVAQSSVITDFDNVEKKPRFNKLQIRLIIAGLALLTIAIIVGLIVNKAQANYNEARNYEAKKYFESGLAKNRSKDYQGAIADFTEAIRLDPNDGYAYSFRGKAKADLKDYQSAIADYNEAIRLDPNDGYVYSLRGDTKVSLGDQKGGFSDYRIALKMHKQKGERSFSLLLELKLRDEKPVKSK